MSKREFMEVVRGAGFSELKASDMWDRAEDDIRRRVASAAGKPDMMFVVYGAVNEIRRREREGKATSD